MRASQAGLGNLDDGVNEAIIQGILTGSAIDVFHNKAISILPNNDQSIVLKNMKDFIGSQEIPHKYTRNEDVRLALDWFLSEAVRVGIDQNIIDAVRQRYHKLKV